VALALTEDFHHFERYGVIMPPEIKMPPFFPIGSAATLRPLAFRPVFLLDPVFFLSYTL
jgi:hypothetical protein